MARELLADAGSIFVQIGPDNAHRVRALLDEVFGFHNACTMIIATTTAGLGAKLLPDIHTHLLWYAKDREQVKYRQLYLDKELGGEGGGAYTWVELEGGERRRQTAEERANPARATRRRKALPRLRPDVSGIWPEHDCALRIRRQDISSWP